MSSVKNNKASVRVSFEQNEVIEDSTFDKVLVAVGVVPNTQAIGLEENGIDMENGYIAVDDTMKTSIANIYAIGDITGKLPLAHVASAQANIAVESICGMDTVAEVR